jgi:hypothetical protein
MTQRCACKCISMGGMGSQAFQSLKAEGKKHGNISHV